MVSLNSLSIHETPSLERLSLTERSRFLIAEPISVTAPPGNNFQKVPLPYQTSEPSGTACTSSGPAQPALWCKVPTTQFGYVPVM